MKTKLTFFTFVFFFIIGAVSAQDFSFRVLASKGSNSADGSALRVGSKISNTANINVGADSYLGLAHVSGKTLELKAGTYTVKDLNEQVKNASASNLTSKYMDFVVSELTKKEDKQAMARRYKHMSKTGAVSRAIDDPIVVMLDQKAQVLGDKAAITWFVNEARLPQGVDANSIKTFNVSIMDLFGNEVYNTQTEDTHLIVDISKYEGKGLTYVVTAVENKAVKAPEQSLKRLKTKDFEKYSTDYAELRKNDSALGKIIQAKYLEEQGLLVDAMAAYEEAISMESDVESYKELYAEFLQRAAFTPETYKAKIEAAKAQNNK